MESPDRKRHQTLPCPRETAPLQLMNEELCRLNSDEMARFDGWANKGIALLGASGLILSLGSFGFPLLRIPETLTSPVEHIAFILLRQLPFMAAISLFFLSSVLSLVSLRARPLQRLDEDAIARLAKDDTSESLKNLADTRLAMYKKNVEAVNAKATRVNQAWLSFFWGCAAQMVFLATLVIWIPRQ
jgi:hypothetical protein